MKYGYVEIILAMVKYALERDMVPVVDLKNCPNTYLEPNEVGKINSWNFSFISSQRKVSMGYMKTVSM